MSKGLFIYTFLFLSLIGCKQKLSEPGMYNILDYGAIENGVFLNSKVIQKAIDECSENGGGTVIVPAGTYKTGTIILKNNVTLKLEKDALLLGSTEMSDYKNIDPFTDAVGQERGNCLIGAIDAKNIGIIGEGSIDGQGEEFTAWRLKGKGSFSKRPFLLRFVRSENITLQGVHIKNSAAWNCHFYQSKKILVESIIVSGRVNHNNDGIDIDSSSDVKILNSEINTGDDGICVKTTSPVPSKNIYVENCVISSKWGAFKIGTESMGDFKNIMIKDCIFDDVRGGGIKLLSVDGANMDSISIENVKMTRVDTPIFIRLGRRLRTYRGAPKQAVGSIKNIRIQNINAQGISPSWSRVNPPSAILITGIPNKKIENIVLEDVTIELPGGGLETIKNIQVPELEDKYPEAMNFGVLPAYGAFIRHAEGVELNNVKITSKKADEREKYKFVDAQVLIDNEEYNLD